MIVIFLSLCQWNWRRTRCYFLEALQLKFDLLTSNKKPWETECYFLPCLAFKCAPQNIKLNYDKYIFHPRFQQAPVSHIYSTRHFFRHSQKCVLKKFVYSSQIITGLLSRFFRQTKIRKVLQSSPQKYCSLLLT